MFNLTKDKFIESLKQISPDCRKRVEILLEAKCVLPEITKNLVLSIFIEKTSESKQSKLLREYLVILNKDGCVDFEA
jgi:hypothetical protein